MAIYRCNHTTIGRSTHPPGTAAAHINYITRESATTEIIAQHMPEDRHQAKRWITEQEISDVKDARVIDKVNIALPLELNHEQQRQLVIDYCKTMTQERTPWYAAIHSQPQDAHNPHAHLVFRDRDIETRRRVMMTSERGSTQIFREKWEQVCNTHLAMHGHTERIDRRTLEAQGIDRIPQIHIGPEANAAVRRGAELKSIIRDDKKKIGQDKTAPPRKINYPEIDKGMTRRAFNDHIIDLNLERLRRSPNYATRLKAEYETEQRKRDRELLKERDDIRRYAKAANGEIWQEFSTTRDAIIKNKIQDREQMVDNLKSDFKPIWNDHFERKKAVLNNFEKKQKDTEERLEILKRSLPHLWSQPGPTQDKTRGHLSAVFDQSVNKEQRLKDLKGHYSKEHQKVYKKYTEEKNVLAKMLQEDSDQAINKIKNNWETKKTVIKTDTDSLWKDYSQKLRERNYEKKFERQNLQTFIDDYNKEHGSTPQEKRAVKTNLQERIQKAAQESKRPSTGGGPDMQPAHDNKKTVLEEHIEKAKSPKTGGGQDRDR